MRRCPVRRLLDRHPFATEANPSTALRTGRGGHLSPGDYPPQGGHESGGDEPGLEEVQPGPGPDGDHGGEETDRDEHRSPVCVVS